MPEPYGTIPRMGTNYGDLMRREIEENPHLAKHFVPSVPNPDAMREGMTLLGEIIAALSIERNRRSLEETEIGRCLVVIADRWIERYHKIKERTQA